MQKAPHLEGPKQPAKVLRVATLLYHAGRWAWLAPELLPLKAASLRKFDLLEIARHIGKGSAIYLLDFFFL